MAFQQQSEDFVLELDDKSRIIFRMREKELLILITMNEQQKAIMLARSEAVDLETWLSNHNVMRSC